MIEFTRKYANNDQTCEEFFLRAKYPNGYYCKKCGCTHCRKISTRNHVYNCSKCCHLSCLFAGTIFQDCKLDLYKLLLGLFIFFTCNKMCQRNGDAFSAGCKLQDCITAVQKMQSVDDRMQFRKDTG